jgi:acyl-CoA synthetase (AMP-forming)/AMP-acid ligase II
MAIIDFFDRGWDMDGKAIAYIQGERSFTFDEVGDLSCRIANTLLSLGLPKETKGAVWSGNDVMAWTCTLGLWRANMAWIPVNPRNAAEDNGYILDAFDCEVLFFQQAYSRNHRRPASRLAQGQALDLHRCRPAGCPIAGKLVRRPARHPNPLSLPGWTMCSSSCPPAAPPALPKGVMNTHRAAQTFFAHFMLACTYRDGTPPVNLAAAPMTHTAGLLSLPCTAQGGTVVVLPRPDPMLLVQAIAQHRVTEFFLPPTVIYALLEAPGSRRSTFRAVRYLLYGAAPMSVEKLKKAIALWGPVHDRILRPERGDGLHRHPAPGRAHGGWAARRATDGSPRSGVPIRWCGGDHGRCQPSCRAARPARSACAAT